MAHVDLCSGIGGFALGFERAGLSKPVQFCDIEPWSRRVLSKHWPDVPIAEDVKELARDPDRNVFDCDILSAGYPCQPFSVAGNQKGAEDDRHIWPYIREIVAHKRPAWCVFENVYGHIGLGLDQVLFDLESEGYASRTFVVPACGVDAPHRRDRLWIIAKNVGDTKHDGSLATKIGRSDEKNARGSEEGSEITEQSSRASRSGHDETLSRPSDVANTDSNDGRHISSTKPSERQTRLEYRRGGDRQPIGEPKQIVADADSQRGRLRNAEWQNAEDAGQPSGNQRDNARGMGFWDVEPSVGRVAHGIPKRVDRLRGLGNAIVPQIAQRIGETIRKIEEREA